MAMKLNNLTLQGIFGKKNCLWTLVSLLLVASLPSCKNRLKEKSDEELMKMAREISQDNLIIDSHIDWPEWLLNFPEDISKLTQQGDFDLERANEGGLNATMSVIYINSEFGVDDGRELVDSLRRQIAFYTETYPDKFSGALTPDEVRSNFSRQLFSLPVCLENGSPIGEDIEYLEHLKDIGVVYVTLCHDETNQISDSNFDEYRRWNGLSPFGLEVIRELNRLGIMIDISHSTDSTVYQALRYSSAPVVATHSSCRHFTPGYERNLSDTLIKLIADKDGVIMVNFGSMFLDSVCLRNCNEAIGYMSSRGITSVSPEGVEYLTEFVKTHKVVTDSKQLVNHIDHIVKIAGIDHVGLGSDFNGVGPTQPADVRDVSGYPVIVFELLKRGYSEDDISKILSGNFLRVWDKVIENGKEITKALAI
jgi:membrane dipeptidase